MGLIFDLFWCLVVFLLFCSTEEDCFFFVQLISVQGELCVRGYWNCPDQMSKAQLHDWFKKKVDEIGLADVKDTLYFPQYAGSVFPQLHGLEFVQLFRSFLYLNEWNFTPLFLLC